MHSSEQPRRRPGRVEIYSLIYLGLLGLLLILSLIFSANAPLVGLIRTALVAMLWPALLLLAIALVARRWRMAGVLMIPVLALIGIYAPYFVPRSQPPIEGAPIITVLTLNVHQPATDADREAIATIIRSADADIVALQELGTESEATLGPLVDDVYPYQVHEQDETYSGSGQGLLSKYPIRDEAYDKAGGPWNGNLRVELDIDGQRVMVYNVHPHPPIERGLDPQMASHANVLRGVLDRANADGVPVLLVGDFNMTPRFETYRWITASFTDAYREVGQSGFGFTHPHIQVAPVIPFWRIDYVFYDVHFHGIDARLLPASPHTDHFPLLVRLQLLDE